MFFGSPNTQRSQRILYERWIKPIFPDNTIDETGLQLAIEVWSKKLKPNTVRALVSISRKVHLYKHGTPIRVHSRVNVPQNTSAPVVKALNKEDARKLLEVGKKMWDRKFYLAVCLGYHAGLRRGEVFALEWGDIDFFRNVILISKSISGPTKGRKTRLVPMSDQLSSLLVENSLTFSKKIFDHPYKTSPRLRKACKRAKVPVITFHGLRHTFATLALDSGQSIKKVQNMLGHSKASTTIDIYWNYIPSDLRVDFT